MARGTGVGNGAQRDNSEDAFQQHAAVSDGFRVTFLVQLLGRRTGRYEGMEARNSTAGDGREENREQEQDAVLRGHGEARESREQVRIDIGMGAENADYGDNQHGIQQEGTQIVTRLEQDPDRGDRGDGDVNADEDHPGLGGEIQRMPIHADGHDEDDGRDAKDRRGYDGGVPVINEDAEHDGDDDEEQGNHGHGGIGRAGCLIEDAVPVRGAEGRGNNGCEGCHDENQRQVGEGDKELFGAFGHIGRNNFPDGLSLVPDRRKERPEIMDAAEEDGRYFKAQPRTSTT